VTVRAATVPGRFKSSAAGRSAAPVLTWRATQMRSKIVLFLLMVGFLAVIVRAFMLQLVNADQWQTRAEKRFERLQEIPATRGRVLDRHGAVIASSVREEQLGIVPSRFIADEPKAATADGAKSAKRVSGTRLSDRRIDALAEILGMPAAELRAKITGSKKFFYLAKGLDAEKADRIRALRLDGTVLEFDFRRYYPYGDAFAHVIGFTNAEEKGAEGIEATLDPQLQGTPGKVRHVVDRTNRPVGHASIVDPAPGKDLRVSLDASIQTIVQNALKTAMAEHRAKAASAVVIDAQTGEVLALVNEPSFDPNNRARLNADTVRNRAITDTFEPGSTMKSFSIAAAIELGRVTPTTEIQTAPGKMTIGNRTIGDAHPHGVLTVEGVLAKSSNVGTVKIAQKLQPQEMHGFYSAAGFGRVPDVGLQGAVTGRLRNPDRWVPIDQAVISYGHGVSVSLLQLARAYTVFARDGDVVPLSFVPQTGPVAGYRVFSPETARTVRAMLEQATGPQGTAPKAQVAGFRVGGKTGTAYKPERGGYAKNKYVASFVGFAPADKPKFVIAVMVDEPSAGQHYGGQVAAPVFSQIANDTLRRFQISPNPSLRVLPAVALIGEGTQ
jgi:cell division protein FtsI (penicillin-binding protein 3)